MKPLALLAVLLFPSLAQAGAWTRDQGHFYLGASYSYLGTDRFYDPDFKVVPIVPYTQHVVGLYGEVGILSRWLTATVEGTLYRRGEIAKQGYTEGVGDWRLGAWTGLITHPVRLSFGVIVGFPTGDPLPNAGPNASPDAQLVARSLPTGDGEWDVETRVAFGYSFGGVRRWPVVHYLTAEAGYWFRTRGFADDFTYRLELGTKFPYRFIERFWFIVKLGGIESFASAAQASRDATGLGDGVTYLSPGVDVYGRIWRGLGAQVGIDSALRARSIAAGIEVRSAVSYVW